MENTFRKFLLKTDNRLNVLEVDKSFLAYVGVAHLENLEMVVPPADIISLMNAVFSLSLCGSTMSCFRLIVSDGHLNWIAANIEAESNNVINMEFSDIQSLKSEGVLSRYDPMTGLYNKAAITEIAHETIDRFKESKDGFYFCLLDIDHFKEVNDVFGHMKGDEVITDVAHMIRDAVGDYGSVGRIGGDEFMVILDKVNQKPLLREILGNIRESVEEKYARMEEGMHITLSIGASLFPAYSDHYDGCFKLTDKMLYRAKEKGKNRFIIYTPDVHGNMRNGESSGKTQHRVFTEHEKVTLMRVLLQKFLHRDRMTAHDALKEVLRVYRLDCIYVFFGTLSSSRFGIKKLNDNVVDSAISLPDLREMEFVRNFDELGILKLVYSDLNPTKHPLRYHFMVDQVFRSAVIMRMSRAPERCGFVIYAMDKDSSFRLSEGDVIELKYFTYMLETALLERC